MTNETSLIKYLESEGHTVVSKKEDYYADVVTEKDGVTFFSRSRTKSTVERGVAYVLGRNKNTREEEKTK